MVHYRPRNPASPPRELRKRRIFSSHRYINFFLGSSGLILFIISWEIAARLVFDPLFLPPPSSVLVEAYQMFASGEIYPHIFVSLKNFGIGLLLSALIGISLGFVLGWYRFVRKMFDPLLSALYATPKIAIFPLIVLIFGIQDESKIVITFLACVFPILLNTMSGVMSTDIALVEMARSMGAQDVQIFRNIVIHSALRQIVTGIRLAIGRGLVFIIVAEMFASTSGLGHLTFSYGATFQTAKMFVPIVVISLIGIVTTFSLELIERHIEPWRKMVTQEGY
jgi:ABC-type nitrate/sulfonate/bicarbonate transport system permease component